VKGRTLSRLLAGLLALALLAQTVRWRDRLLGSRLLKNVELLTGAAIENRRAPAQFFADALESLGRAARLDPVEVGVPIARGNLYLLLSRPDPAIRAYRESLALEPRPEGYYNLGRALWLAGRRPEALRSFELAVRLDPFLAPRVEDVTR
jgi:tetratricopeptide (TPR) repeat protein